MKKHLFVLFYLFSTLLAAHAQVVLSFRFITGNDDLRGGNDNVHIVVLLSDSRQLSFNNVNARRSMERPLETNGEANHTRANSHGEHRWSTD